MLHYLHGRGDALPVTEDLMEVLGAQDVPQGCLGQQSGGTTLLGGTGYIFPYIPKLSPHTDIIPFLTMQ